MADLEWGLLHAKANRVQWIKVSVVKGHYIHSVPCPAFYIHPVNIAVAEEQCVDYLLASKKKVITVYTIVGEKGFAVETAETTLDPPWTTHRTFRSSKHRRISCGTLR